MGLKFTAYIYEKYNIGRTGHLKSTASITKNKNSSRIKSKDLIV